MSTRALERHLTLYFLDGDVVLAASTDGATRDSESATPVSQVFRVHKFLLKHHSPTFANMFLDADAASGESYDGVPMVELQGDKAEDLALLLNYLYNPTQMTFKRFDPNTPLVVRGVIRLADKYCIESLREHLIKVVAGDWPTTLQEWDVFQIEIKAVKERLAITNRGGKKGPELEHLCDYIPEPASAIVFAQEFGCREILPAAYYQLLSISPHFEWDSDWKKMALVARWTLLDRDTLLRCMKGSETVTGYRPTPFQLLSLGCYPSITYEDEPEALLHSPCYSFLRQMIGSVWDSRTGMLRKDPLEFLSKCLEYETSRGSYRDELCDECRASLPDKIANLRQKLWDRLCHITLR